MMNEWKETKIGMIPADWKVKPLFQLNSSKDTEKTNPLGSLLHLYDYAD